MRAQTLLARSDSSYACIAVSEAYASKDSCKNGIASVKKKAPKAKIDAQTM